MQSLERTIGRQVTGKHASRILLSVKWHFGIGKECLPKQLVLSEKYGDQLSLPS